MNISGLVKSSLIDYPGRIAAVVFAQGCNFRCGFCHNPDLIPGGKGEISEIQFFEFLTSRKGKLDGVVITGGEPTLQADLPFFITRIKEHDFSVKLDTNGSNPRMLKDLLDRELVDFVAMDIKGPLESYSRIAHFSETQNILQSIELIKRARIPHEFRTTVLPAFHKTEDFKKIGALIKGGQKYAIQGFRDENVFDKSLRGTPKFSDAELEEIEKIMSLYVPEIVIRKNS